MKTKKVKTEKEFLISTALRQFNDQYDKTIAVENCDIKSIPTRWSFERSYEINTLRMDDFLRLHIHIRFEGRDGLSKYTLEVDSIATQLPDSEGTLFDEVFVATGSIDPYYKNEGIYKFRLINLDTTLLDILITEGGEDILLEDGSQILLETGI